MTGVRIISDFVDYYDCLSSDEEQMVYHRNYGDCSQRGKALHKLQIMGIKTIEVQQVERFVDTLSEKLVVYIDPRQHNGKGKRIMTVGEAKQTYPNYIASKFYEGTTEYIKFLQVGKRRFIINCKRTDENDLSKHIITDINEISSELNRLVSLPIFSINYISVDNAMVATDFNEVERLDNCGVKDLLKPEQVIEEIKNSLVAYNKV